MLVLGWKIGWFTCGEESGVGEFIVTVDLFKNKKTNHSGLSVDKIIIIDTTTLSYVHINDSYAFYTWFQYHTR